MPKHSSPEVVCNSPEMARVLRLATQVASTNSTVLIAGETGVGKEVLARRIHGLSHLRDDVFLPINCAAFPEELLESQLFGHAKGAFTGAEAANQGLFYHARGGTIFLDEIGELSSALQVKLLRLIEDKEILPLGTVDPIEVDMRIIAATNRNLRTEVDAGRFREDLFYRLSVINIEIPPLRARRADIRPLVEQILQSHNIKLGRDYVGVDADTFAVLYSLPMRGNVRELSHLLEFAMIVGEGTWIRPTDLPAELLPDPAIGTLNNDHLRTAMRRFTKSHIEDVLHRSEGDRRKAALALGVDLSTLYRKMSELEVDQS